LHTWLVKERAEVLPKSPMAEAIGYALNNWTALAYVAHPSVYKWCTRGPDPRVFDKSSRAVLTTKGGRH
jgi:hypothetical protein